MEPETSGMLPLVMEMGKEGGPWMIFAVLVIKWLIDRRANGTATASPGNGNAVMRHVVDEIHGDVRTNRDETRNEGHHTRQLVRGQNEELRSSLGDLTTAINTLNSNVETQTRVIERLSTSGE